MRLATYLLPADRTPRVGVVIEDQMLDLAAAARTAELALPSGSMRQLLAGGKGELDAVRSLVASARADASAFSAALSPRAAVKLMPPIPDPSKFICAGKNYRSHLEELKKNDLIRETPQEPTGFIKLNHCLVGHDGDVVRPPSVNHLDYEPELVFVIGRHAHNVAKEDAFNYVAGITILNDLTCRATQKREVASGSRFWTAKNAPGFGPLGPFIITMDDVPDPYDIWITCTVNGQQRMRVNTSAQIWKLPDILSHFSRLVPFEPGDMFATGAPGGVAVGQPNADELFLKPGDVVECAFEEPAMVLRNRIVAPQ